MTEPAEIKIREFVKLEKGKPPAQKPYYGPDAARYLTPEYLRGVASCELAKPSSKAVRISDGDSILLWDGSNAGEVLYGRDGILASTMSRASHNDRFDSQYFFYALKQWEPFMKAQTSGSGIPHIDKEVLGKLAIIEFDMREQSKIAEVLSTVDRAIEQTAALIAKQECIKTGLMQDLLTRGIDEHSNLRSEATHEFKDSPVGRIPVGWEVSALKDIVDEPITYGIVQAGPHVEDGVPYIRTGDMAGDAIDRAQLLRTSFEIARSYNRSAVHTGDIVFALRATVGKVLPVTNELDGANLTQGTAKISPHSSIDTTFLLWALRAFPVQHAIRLEQKGTTFMEITLGNLRNIQVALPRDIEKQREIAVRLEGVEQLRNNYLWHRDKLSRLKAGLMQDLLTGKRRVTTLLKDGKSK